MQQSELRYLPLSPGYFSLLVGVFAVLLGWGAVAIGPANQIAI